MGLNIDGPWNSGPNSFSISTTYANPLFGDHAVTHNTALLPNITPIFDAATQTVGFSLPEGTLNATSRKWLFSITYDYSLSVPGRYSIDTDSERSEIHLAGGPTPFYVAPAEMFVAALEADLFVDDDAPADPGPGDTSVSDPAEDGSAEHPFDAIQEAIDAAQDGQVVVVRDGLYTGAGNRRIYFRG